MIEGRRAVILVIDALGVGEMPDTAATRPHDVGANTLRHVAESVGGLGLPNLSSLGLAQITTAPGLTRAGPTGAFGRNMLAYAGADTYFGHQEIMGTIPGSPQFQLMAEVRDEIWEALEAAGHHVEDYQVPSSMLLVDGVAVVHDNMETDPGRNINVTATYDEMPERDIVRIGEIVRSAVRVSRVIVVMGRGFSTSDIARHIHRDSSAIGVDSPGLGVYNEHYRVRHLGYGVDTRQQVASIAASAGRPVYLLGKAADVIECDRAVRSRDVLTGDVLEKTLRAARETEDGLIVANVQEGDLAGHEQDPHRWAEVLREVDEFLPRILEELHPADVLMVTGDHGNDPTIGHSQHTREYTPILVAGPSIQPVSLGTRTSLADIAATAADVLGLPHPQDGQSFQTSLFGVPA